MRALAASLPCLIAGLLAGALFERNVDIRDPEHRPPAVDALFEPPTWGAALQGPFARAGAVAGFGAGLIVALFVRSKRRHRPRKRRQNG